MSDIFVQHLREIRLKESENKCQIFLLWNSLPDTCTWIATDRRKRERKIRTSSAAYLWSPSPRVWCNLNFLYRFPLVYYSAHCKYPQNYHVKQRPDIFLDLWRKTIKNLQARKYSKIISQTAWDYNNVLLFREHLSFLLHLNLLPRLTTNGTTCKMLLSSNLCERLS